MKEKVIFTLSLSCFIGVMWLSSTTNTTKPNHLIGEKSAPLPINNYSPEYIDNVSSKYWVSETIIMSSAAIPLLPVYKNYIDGAFILQDNLSQFILS